MLARAIKVWRRPVTLARTAAPIRSSVFSGSGSFASLSATPRRKAATTAASSGRLSRWRCRRRWRPPLALCRRGGSVFRRALSLLRPRRLRPRSGGRQVDVPIVGNDRDRRGRPEGALKGWRVIGVRRSRERLRIGRERIEVRRQDRRVGRVQHRRRAGQPGILVGTNLGPRRRGIVVGQEVVVLTRRLFLVDDHLDLVEAELDPVAIAQLLAGALADGVAGLVEERAVGAEILHLPLADAVDELAVLLRQVTVRIGDDPLIFLPPAYGELAAANLAPLGRHVVGATDHDKLQGHVKAHSCRGGERQVRSPKILVGEPTTGQSYLAFVAVGTSSCELTGSRNQSIESCRTP